MSSLLQVKGKWWRGCEGVGWNGVGLANQLNKPSLSLSNSKTCVIPYCEWDGICCQSLLEFSFLQSELTANRSSLQNDSNVVLYMRGGWFKPPRRLTIVKWYATSNLITHSLWYNIHSIHLLNFFNLSLFFVSRRFRLNGFLKRSISWLITNRKVNFVQSKEGTEGKWV